MSAESVVVGSSVWEAVSAESVVVAPSVWVAISAESSGGFVCLSDSISGISRGSVCLRSRISRVRGGGSVSLSGSESVVVAPSVWMAVSAVVMAGSVWVAVSAKSVVVAGSV